MDLNSAEGGDLYYSGAPKGRKFGAMDTYVMLTREKGTLVRNNVYLLFYLI